MERESFSTDELKVFFEKEEPGISRATINWRIRQLSEKGIIKRIGRGIYAMGQTRSYVPPVNPSQKKLFKKIQAAFPYSDLCIWDTSVLNSFMVHQPFHFMTIIETDSDSVTAVFYKLQEDKAQVFLGTDHEMIHRYSSPDKQTVIVKPLVTEAPVQESDGIITITLEKVLVDLFCDDKLFVSYQGNERSVIFENAFRAYTLNQNKLLRYAQRRGQRDNIRAYLENLGLLHIEEKTQNDKSD